jgi:hypothetical protein
MLGCLGRSAPPGYPDQGQRNAFFDELAALTRRPDTSFEKPQGFFERDDRVRVPQTVFNVVEPSGIGSSSRRLTWISDVLPSEPEKHPRILWILAILLAPLLLVRFRNAVGGSLQLGGHEPNHE